jgi:hypothetical protein
MAALRSHPKGGTVVQAPSRTKRIPIRTLFAFAVSLAAFAPPHATANASQVRVAQAAPTAIASPTPAAAATATPAPRPTLAYTRYLAADLALGPKITNGFAPGASGPRVSGDLRAALEYRFRGRNFIELDTHDWSYARAGDHAYERQSTLNSSVVGIGHVFLATSSLLRTNSYGAPRLGSTFGFGVEALPNFERRASLSGSLYYYPDVNGKAATANGPLRIAYKLVTYQLNATLTQPGRPLFLEIGAIGDHYSVKASAPGAQTHRAAHLGIGAHV